MIFGRMVIPWRMNDSTTNSKTVSSAQCISHIRRVVCDRLCVASADQGLHFVLRPHQTDKPNRDQDLKSPHLPNRKLLPNTNTHSRVKKWMKRGGGARGPPCILTEWFRGTVAPRRSQGQPPWEPPQNARPSRRPETEHLPRELVPTLGW